MYGLSTPNKEGEWTDWPTKEDLRKFPFSRLVDKYRDPTQLKETRILKTMFKYPFIRVEEELHPDGTVKNRTEMVADHLQVTLKDKKYAQNFYDDFQQFNQSSGLNISIKEYAGTVDCLLQFKQSSASCEFLPKSLKEFLDKHECTYDPDYLSVLKF